jgi:hypothetical protein
MGTGTGMGMRRWVGRKNQTDKGRQSGEDDNRVGQGKRSHTTTSTFHKQTLILNKSIKSTTKPTNVIAFTTNEQEEEEERR